MARLSNKKKTIGFIGLGHMGQPMAIRLCDAGYNLIVHDKRPEAEEPLIKKGARSGKTPVNSIGDITISVLATPSQVEELYFGNGGLIEGLKKPGSIVIEASGIDPETTLRVEKAVKEKKCRFIACALMASGAPYVSIPRGLLQILAGGEKSCIEECLDIFKTLGQTVVCVPNVIAPKMLKLAIIILSASREIASLEAAWLLKKSGINPAWFAKLMNETGRSHEIRDLKVLLAGGLKLGGNIRNAHKDLSVALQVASDNDLPVPHLANAHQILQACKGAGFEGKGTPESLLALQERILGESLPVSWKLDLEEILPASHPPKVIWLK